MTIENATERTLREALIDLRPEAGVSASLRARVLDIPRTVRMEALWLRVVRRFAVPFAAAGVAAAAAAIAILGMTRAPIVGVPPGTTGAAALGFDPAIEGMGMITNVPPSAMLVGGLLVLVSGGVAARTFFSPRAATTRGRMIVLAGLVGMLAGLGVVRLDVGLRMGSVGGGPLGYVWPASGPFNGGDVMVSTALPGEPTVALFSLTNPSAVPVRIEGVVMPEGYADAVSGHWMGLWLPAESPGYEAPGLETARPFEPITLGPGEHLVIYAAGRAGPCAFGPSSDPTGQFADPGISGFAQLGPAVTVAYSIFGLIATTEIDMGQVFDEPYRGGCSA